MGGLTGFPAATRWRTDWLLGWSLAGARPGPFFIAVLGWFIASWAAVWMLQRWLWGATRKPNLESERPYAEESASRNVLNTVDDLRVTEVLAIIVLLIVLGLVSSGWMSAAFDGPQDVTSALHQTSFGGHRA